MDADKILLCTPLLRGYLEHGVELQAIYTMIEYRPEKCLAWFVDQVTEARCTGGADKETAISAD